MTGTARPPRPAPAAAPKAAYISQPGDPCASCPMFDGFHQYDCPTLPRYSDGDPHLWIAFGDSPGSSCRWCGVMRGRMSEARACRGVTQVGFRANIESDL